MTRHAAEGVDTTPIGWTEDPDDLLALTVQLAEASTGDTDSLVMIAVHYAEALIDLHWELVIDRFEAEASRSAAIRQVISCCDFDSSVPASVRDRLYRLVTPADDIGHQPG